ncbi:MAG: hypothetical protein GYA24_03980 [Candidatus Lokiarchaeota archaeon]|nr:hypothetical protein [Candidatus Lokiarchaeota archaeon]
MRTRTMLLGTSLVVSFLVYMYNVIRFPLFNNDFDPWVHQAIMDGMMATNTLDLDAYLGFPGLHVLVIYIAKMLGLDMFLVVKWFPVFTGVMSSLVAIAFIQHVVEHQFDNDARATVSPLAGDRIVAFGSILNTTVSLFSIVSSGMFWGQMLTAVLLPLIMIKFVELNQRNDNRLIIEFLLLTTTLFLVHHLTSFLLVVFLSFTQLYLMLNTKISIKAPLVTFIAVLVFLLRYEALSLNIGIVSALTWGKTNFFYLYFLGLAIAFLGAFALRKAKPIIANMLPRVHKPGIVKKLGSNLVLMTIVGVILAIAFLAYIYPYILSFFTGLSPSWFLYYGSNLLLLAPLAIAGVIVFGRLLNKTAMKAVVYCWVMTIIFVLALLFGMYFLHLGVGALEFGRLSTFIYPALSIFAAFSVVLILEKRNAGIKKPVDSIFAKVSKRVKPVIRIAILASFCILMPVAVIGFNPPPSATLTRYWNVLSEQTSISWIVETARNNTSKLNVDYHLLEMADYNSFKENKQLYPVSDANLYFLNKPENQEKLDEMCNYLILFDDVILDTSLSYSDANAEHGVLPALGRNHLKTYDALPFLNLVYCTSSQWLYQCYIE